MNNVQETVTGKVIDALELLIKAGGCFQGMFPSFMRLDDWKPLYGLPDLLPGQRPCDRAAFGSNLMHDHITLRTCYDMARLCDRPDLAEGADAYLRYFARHCTNTITGLFPWGEHAYWDISDNRPGNAWTHTVWGPRNHPIHHDHLRQAPLWLWDKLWEFNPDAVVRFAEGLDNHWQEIEPSGRQEFNRHAYIDEWKPYVATGTGKGFDFPRHAGFYIFDWAYVYSRTHRDDMRARIMRMLDYHWNVRDNRGLLPMHGRWNVRQTLSLAMSLLDTSELLIEVDPALADTARLRAAAYMEGFLTAQSEAPPCHIVAALPKDPKTQSLFLHMSLAGGRVGEGGGESLAHLCCCAFRKSNDERFLDIVLKATEAFLDTDIESAEVDCPRATGMTLAVLSDLIEFGKGEWQRSWERVAARALPVIFDQRLPRAIASADFYESEVVPGRLLHSLARLGTGTGNGCFRMNSDYSQR